MSAETSVHEIDEKIRMLDEGDILLTKTLFKVQSGIAERLYQIGIHQHRNSQPKIEKKDADLVSQPKFVLFQLHTSTKTLSNTEALIIELASEL